jgi:hypothetical protein
MSLNEICAKMTYLQVHNIWCWNESSVNRDQINLKYVVDVVIGDDISRKAFDISFNDSNLFADSAVLGSSIKGVMNLLEPQYMHIKHYLKIFSNIQDFLHKCTHSWSNISELLFN